VPLASFPQYLILYVASSTLVMDAHALRFLRGMSIFRISHIGEHLKGYT